MLTRCYCQEIGCCLQPVTSIRSCCVSNQTLLIQFQHREEGLLWHFHIADLPHAFLAFFLFFQQLPFPADITTITFRGNIFSHCRDRFPCDHLCADRGLDRDLELLSWNKFFQFFTQASVQIPVHGSGGSSALKASTLSPFNRISILTISLSRYSMG